MARSKSTKTKPEKKTAEQLSDQERQRLLFAHRRKLKPLLAAKRNADDAVRKAFELAKKEGIPKKELDLAIRLETEDGVDAVRGQIEQMLRIDRWVGAEIGVQLEMFAKQDSRERNFEDGRRAALDDKPAKPPGHLSQQAEKHWLDGHAEGVKQISVSRAEGFRPLGTVAADMIGTEPPTHSEATH